MPQNSLDLSRELEQLHAHSLKVFLPADATSAVTVSTFPVAPKSIEPPPSPLTIVDDGSRLHTVQVDNLRALDNVLEQYPTSTCKLRLYSIHQRHSYSALNINQHMISRMLETHSITPKFLRHLSAFYQRNEELEKHYVVPFHAEKHGEVIEYMYTMKYAEFKPDCGNMEPWTIRQSCIYHQYHTRAKSSVLVLVSPTRDSSAETRIMRSLQLHLLEPERHDAMHFAPGTELVTSHLDFWRPYLRFYEERVEKLSRDLMGSQPNLDATPADIHFFESRFLPVDPALSALTRTLEGVKMVYSDLASAKLGTSDFALFAELESRLDEVGRQLPAYQCNSSALLQKCSSLTQLLEKTVAMKQGQHLLKLTEETKIITVVALSYLSFSVVAAIISMPLFYLDDSHNKLLLSPAFWIYIAVSVPLTLATFLWWKVQMWRNRASSTGNSVSTPRRWWTSGRKKLGGSCLC